MKKNAFTMIELVFVIVILGILAAIAIPKFAATRTDAIIAKGRSDVASIRSGIINERQTRLIKGETSFIDPADLSTSDGLFAGVLTYPIKDSTDEGHWHKLDDTTYTFKIGDQTCTFKYTQSSGKFDLDDDSQTKSLCKKLVE